MSNPEPPDNNDPGSSDPGGGPTNPAGPVGGSGHDPFWKLVQDAYQTYYGRPATDAEVDGHRNNPGGFNGVLSWIINSPEAGAYRNQKKLPGTTDPTTTNPTTGGPGGPSGSFDLNGPLFQPFPNAAPGPGRAPVIAPVPQFPNVAGPAQLTVPQIAALRSMPAPQFANGPTPNTLAALMAPQVPNGGR